LREEIKERIKKIKRGEVPEGYKKTKIGIIPFDWKQDKLLNNALIVDGTHQTPQYMDKGVRFVSVENIGNIENSEKYISYEEFEKIKIKPIKNDILMTRITAGIIGDTQIVESNEPMGYYVSLALIRCKEGINVFFINQLIKSYFFRKELHKRIIHTAFPKKINLGDIGDCQLLLPNAKEQEKIVELLEVMDSRINKLQSIIIEKKKQKKWLLQELLSGKRRLVKFKDEWKKIKLEDIFLEIDERTEENDEYPILTSSRKGMFFQSDYFNKQVASQNNTGYKIIREGQFTYRAMSDDGNYTFNVQNLCFKGIVSPAYSVFSINNQKANDYYIYQFLNDYSFTRYLRILQQGGTRQSLNFDKLCNVEVKLPALNEQIAIANILFKANQEIELQQQQLELLTLEKKAMMQLLLTGIVRVN
jgi:type I restriction enzyme, S subunit